MQAKFACKSAILLVYTDKKKGLRVCVCKYFLLNTLAERIHNGKRKQAQEIYCLKQRIT
jgi:hypothetical protein